MDKGPVYLVENSSYDRAYERIAYSKGNSRKTHDLEVLDHMLLECRVYGTRCEVNVLEQKQDKGVEVAGDDRRHDEIESEMVDVMEEMKGKIHETQKRLKKLVVQMCKLGRHERRGEVGVPR